MISKSVNRNTETGTFILCDAEFLESYGGKPSGCIQVPAANYHADISVKSAGGFFFDIPPKRGLLQVRSGRLYVGDPGAAFPSKNWNKMTGYTKKWHDFLDATNNMKSVPTTVKVIDTSGDGVGTITFKLTDAKPWKSDKKECKCK